MENVGSTTKQASRTGLVELLRLDLRHEILRKARLFAIDIRHISATFL